MLNQKHFEMLPQFQTLRVSVKEGERKSAAASAQPEIAGSHSSTLPRGTSPKGSITGERRAQGNLQCPQRDKRSCLGSIPDNYKTSTPQPKVTASSHS
jgi:hypothetical protein